MYFSGEIIFFVSLLIGAMFGWLLGTMTGRKGFALVGDISAGIVVALIGCWLTLAARDIAPLTGRLSSGKQATSSNIDANVADLGGDLAPSYEAVVPPLTPLP